MVLSVGGTKTGSWYKRQPCGFSVKISLASVFRALYPHMKPVRLAELDRPSVRVHDSAVLSHVHILNTWWKRIMLVYV